MGRIEESRESLIQKFTPKQRAVFVLLEHLDKLESEMGERIEVKWNYGRSANTLIDMVYLDGGMSLPMPRNRGSYVSFSWIMKDLPKSYGCTDIRIIDVGEGFDIKANIGTIKGLEKHLAMVFDSVELQVNAYSRGDLLYSNPAARKLNFT